jgi:hypothetical protein
MSSDRLRAGRPVAAKKGPLSLLKPKGTRDGQVPLGMYTETVLRSGPDPLGVALSASIDINNNRGLQGADGFMVGPDPIASQYAGYCDAPQAFLGAAAVVGGAPVSMPQPGLPNTVAPPGLPQYDMTGLLGGPGID